MNLIEELANRKYLEALRQPKFDKSLENLLDRYSDLITEYLVYGDGLAKIIDKAQAEHNCILIRPGYAGRYQILVWKEL